MKNLRMQFALLLLVTLFSLTSAFGQVLGVIAGTDLTGGGMSGYVTLNLDTTQVPQLSTPNTFTNNQTVNGNVSANSFSLGGYLFDYGSYTNENAFLGFAGNSTTTGRFNTASGYQALAGNTSGQSNTADGHVALYSNTSGFNNTAVGELALDYNSTGANNTGVGVYAGVTADESFITGSLDSFLGYGSTMSKGSLSNATAIGAFAEVAASNSMVLGSINGVNGATASTKVGIGTTAPTAALDVVGNSLQALIGDPGCGSGFAGVGFVNKGGFNSCSNYALLGDVPGNLYVNSSLSGKIYFRNNNGTLMTIDTSGDVNIKGNLSKGGGSFKIDHPLDPANKYLYHSFVESPDMMNVYNGNITTNKAGLATVVLPDYFEALNRDFRYQLTVIGQFAQAIVAKEVSKGRFTIKTNRPGVKVSWQVTGIRQDAYANAHRIPTEVEKPPQEQGHYLHPELFGVGPEQAVGYDGSQSPAPALGEPTPTGGSRP